MFTKMLMKMPLPCYAPEGSEGGDPASAESTPASEPAAEPKSAISEGGQSNGTTQNEEGKPEEKPGEEGSGEESDGKKNDSAEEIAPLTVEDIKFPDGIEVDSEALSGFVELMNNKELSPAELGQKLVDLQMAGAQQAAEASAKVWTDLTLQWKADAKALPEIGGDNLNITLADIKSGLDKLGATDETYAALDLTGAGNHPEIIRILHKATAHLKEGAPLGDNPRPSKANLRQADRLFNKQE